MAASVETNGMMPDRQHPQTQWRYPFPLPPLDSEYAPPTPSPLHVGPTQQETRLRVSQPPPKPQTSRHHSDSVYSSLGSNPSKIMEWERGAMPAGQGVGPVTDISGPDGPVAMQGPGGMYLWCPPFVGAGAVECGAYRPEQGRNVKAEQAMEGGEGSWGFVRPHLYRESLHGASQYGEGGAKRGYEDSGGGGVERLSGARWRFCR